MFRKEAVSTIGGYDPNERHAEDFGLWGRLLEKGDFLGLDTPLLNFRIHPESISHQKRETQIELTRKIGTSHCSRFMRLTPEQSQRAYDALTAGRHSGNWHEWSWFLRYCLPRLRWKSTEMFAWVSVQSARMILRTLKKQRVR